MKFYSPVLFFILGVWTVTPFVAWAASPQIVLTADQSEVSVGQPFVVEIALFPDGESINAVAGEIILPESLDLKRIKDGRSIINFWIERPAARDRKIIFSGIIPGGFTGRNGLVFSLELEANIPGTATLRVREPKILRNDGAGSEAAVEILPISITVIDRIGSAAETRSPSIIDDVEPESFRPLLSQDPSLFNGDWFLVFLTQDKQSGVDYYEVREEIDGDVWLKTESPYRLRDQSLQSNIYVRAIDRAGNIRLETVILRSRYFAWIYGVILTIASVFVIWLIVFIVRKLRRRSPFSVS